MNNRFESKHFLEDSGHTEENLSLPQKEFLGKPADDSGGPPRIVFVTEQREWNRIAFLRRLHIRNGLSRERKTEWEAWKGGLDEAAGLFDKERIVIIENGASTFRKDIHSLKRNYYRRFWKVNCEALEWMENRLAKEMYPDLRGGLFQLTRASGGGGGEGPFVYTWYVRNEHGEDADNHDGGGGGGGEEEEGGGGAGGNQQGGFFPQDKHELASKARRLFSSWWGFLKRVVTDIVPSEPSYFGIPLPTRGRSDLFGPAVRGPEYQGDGDLNLLKSWNRSPLLRVAGGSLAHEDPHFEKVMVVACALKGIYNDLRESIHVWFLGDDGTETQVKDMQELFPQSFLLLERHAIALTAWTHREVVGPWIMRERETDGGFDQRSTGTGGFPSHSAFNDLHSPSFPSATTTAATNLHDHLVTFLTGDDGRRQKAALMVQQSATKTVRCLPYEATCDFSAFMEHSFLILEQTLYMVSLLSKACETSFMKGERKEEQQKDVNTFPFLPTPSFSSSSSEEEREREREREREEGEREVMSSLPSTVILRIKKRPVFPFHFICHGSSDEYIFLRVSLSSRLLSALYLELHFRYQGAIRAWKGRSPPMENGLPGHRSDSAFQEKVESLSDHSRIALGLAIYHAAEGLWFFLESMTSKGDLATPSSFFPSSTNSSTEESSYEHLVSDDCHFYRNLVAKMNSFGVDSYQMGSSVMVFVCNFLSLTIPSMHLLLPKTFPLDDFYRMSKQLTRAFVARCKERGVETAKGTFQGHWKQMTDFLSILLPDPLNLAHHAHLFQMSDQRRKMK